MRILVTATVILCTSSALNAQLSAERPVRVVVSGGLQLPTGSFADYHDLGIHADVAVSLNLGGLRLRPELSYSRFALKELALPQLNAQAAGGAAGGARTGAYDDALSSLLGGFANLELPFGTGGVQPFLLAGVGAVSLATDATAGNIEVSNVTASLNLGAGIRFRLGAIAGLIEARLNNVPAGDSRAYFKDVRTIPVTFGFVF